MNKREILLQKAKSNRKRNLAVASNFVHVAAQTMDTEKRKSHTHHRDLVLK